MSPFIVETAEAEALAAVMVDVDERAITAGEGAGAGAEAEEDLAVEVEVEADSAAPDKLVALAEDDDCLSTVEKRSKSGRPRRTRRIFSTAIATLRTQVSVHVARCSRACSLQPVPQNSSRHDAHAAQHSSSATQLSTLPSAASWTSCLFWHVHGLLLVARVIALPYRRRRLMR
jgi:hypothetical protein